MERTRIITSISIVAVVVAAAAAVGANVGLLENATGTKVGELAATGDLPTTAAGSVGSAGPGPAVDAGDQAAGSRSFVVDRAGTVTVTPGPAALRLGAVAATPGWTWSVSDQGPAHLVLRFTDGADSLLFTARTAVDGTVTGSVEPVGSPPGSTAADHEDDDRGEDDEDDEDDHDGYEGRDDDD